MRPIVRWLDQRVDLVSIRETLFDRKMPAGLTWWHTLGSAALTVFVVQIVTGIVLAMYYSPSPDHAYDSIRFIQRNVLSGATLRGMHHWGSSAMVVLVVAHMVRVFMMGAYKYPREANWVLGVLLFAVVMGFGFTGYLLPWDQKAYWATQVGTNIAGTAPAVGGTLVKLLRGGSQLGAATLARFFALHVLVLPALLGGIVALHLGMVVRQGIAARARVLDAGAPPRTSDPAYPAWYAERSAASKASGVPFWPDIIAKDVSVATVVVLLLVLLGRFAGAGLEPPADPNDASYTPRPEWYFLPFFQLLKLVPGSMESVVAIGVPGLLIVVLLLLPFFDRRSVRSIRHRPVAMLSLGTITAGCALLFGASAREAVATVPEVGHPMSLAERAGRTLFEQQQCGGCHRIAGEKAVQKKEDVPKDTPDLTEVGLRRSPAWLHSFLEEPTRFHPDSKMPAFGPPTLSHQEIEELAQYLSTLRGKDGAGRQPEYHDTFPELVHPKEKP